MKIRHFFTLILLTAAMSSAAQAAGNASAGEKIVTGVCAACHGVDGNSVITTNPKLAAQHPEYLVKQLSNFKSGDRKNPIMSGMAAALSPEDMANVAAYFSAQAAKGGNTKANAAGSAGEKSIVQAMRVKVFQLALLVMVQQVLACQCNSRD